MELRQDLTTYKLKETNVLPHDLLAATAKLKSFEESFYLATYLWQAHTSSYNYQWKRVKFDIGNATKVPNQPGLYCFVVRPEIAGLNELGYLMYVGEAGDSDSENTLRKRFRSYFTEQGRIKRAYITYLLNQWNGFLHFYHCPVDVANKSNIKSYESELIGAFVPRFNKNDFPAEIANVVKALR